MIGIAGASGSGKTLVARTLHENLGSDKVLILHEDFYYKDLSHLTLEQRARVNYDHPDAFDHEFMFAQLAELLEGKSIEHPIYDFTTHTRKKETRRVGPNSIIILEGILVLAMPEIRKQTDIKIFIDAPLDLCLMRRLKRDIKKRGRTLEAVIEQYENMVRPMYMQFVEPSKRFADLIIPHGGKNTIAIDILKAKIEDLLVH